MAMVCNFSQACGDWQLSNFPPMVRQACVGESVSRCRSNLESLVHGVGQAHDDVGVGVKGDGDTGVPKKLLNVFRVLACHEEYRGAGEPGLVASRKVVPPWAGAGVRLDLAVYRVLVRQAPAERR
jgi:hypothetical protein